MMNFPITLATLGILATLMAPQASASQTPQATTPTCIGVVLPTVKGADGDATAFATGLRDLFVSYLTGPSLRAIPIEARLASQAIEEARQKQCGHVLLTSIARKRDDGNGWGKALGRAAGTAAWYGIPYAGGAATAAARGAAAAGAQAVASMAETTRVRDEATLEYRIGSTETVLRNIPKTEKAKARSDREDILTPLVEKAAESIAATVLRK